jgi:MerR family copper efflux transcriptional regulator
VKRLPLVDEDAPIACSLAPGDVPGRIALLERLRDAATDVARTPHGLRLRFPPDAEVEADVRRFAVDEQRCCTFWAFSVDADPNCVTLRWDGPSAAADLLDHLHRFLVGDEPIGSLGGLL